MWNIKFGREDIFTYLRNIITPKSLFGTYRAK